MENIKASERQDSVLNNSLHGDRIHFENGDLSKKSISPPLSTNRSPSLKWENTLSMNIQDSPSRTECRSPSNEGEKMRNKDVMSKNIRSEYFEADNDDVISARVENKEIMNNNSIRGSEINSISQAIKAIDDFLLSANLLIPNELNTLTRSSDEVNDEEKEADIMTRTREEDLIAAVKKVCERARLSFGIVEDYNGTNESKVNCTEQEFRNESCDKDRRRMNETLQEDRESLQTEYFVKEPPQLERLPESFEKIRCGNLDSLTHNSAKKQMVKYVGSRPDFYGKMAEVIEDSGYGIMRISICAGKRPFFVKRSHVKFMRET